MTTLSVSLLSHIPKLDGSNYAVWKVAINAVFQLYDVDEIVTGTETAPSPANPNKITDEEQKLISDFKKRSKHAASLIILSVDPTLYHLFQEKSDPKEIWNALEGTYEKPAALTAFLTCQKLFRFALLSEGSPMRTQLDELARLRQEISTAGITVSNQHFAFAILQSLPESYSHLSSTLLATADLETIDPSSVIACIIKEESRRSSNPTVAAAKTETKRFNGNCN